jgi:hypothetical protein
VGKAERDVDFDVDRVRIHTEDGSTAEAGEHALPGARTVAERGSRESSDWRGFPASSVPMRCRFCAVARVEIAQEPRTAESG